MYIKYSYFLILLLLIFLITIVVLFSHYIDIGIHNYLHDIAFFDLKIFR